STGSGSPTIRRDSCSRSGWTCMDGRRAAPDPGARAERDRSAASRAGLEPGQEGRELAADVDRARPQLLEQLEDLLALLVAHQHDDLRAVRARRALAPGELPAEGRGLGLIDCDVGRG